MTDRLRVALAQLNPKVGDVDGTMSCVSWIWFLEAIGYTNFLHYIPCRFKEGYGLNLKAVQHLIDDEKADLVITMDTGITANDEHTRNMVLNSLGIVTVLKPLLGYKQCAEIAREGYKSGKSLHQIIVVERQLLTQEKWDEMFSFERLINPDLVAE